MAKQVVGYLATTATTPAGSPFAATSPASPVPGAGTAAPVEDFVNAGPSNTLLGLKQRVALAVGFADIAAVAAMTLGPVFPVGTIITRAWYRVTQTFTSGGGDAASIGIGLEAAGDVVVAIAISDVTNPWDAGNHDCIEVGTTVTFAAQTTTAKQLTFSRGGGQVLTAGALTLFVEFDVI